MGNETTKRWLVLGSVLILTLYLAWNLPESDTDTDVVILNPVIDARQSYNHKTMSKSLSIESVNLFSLVSRKPLDGTVTFNLFGPQIKNQVKNTVKQIEKPMLSTKLQAPQLPFKYIGKLVEGGVVKVFLLEGQALHIMSKGDKIDDRYQLQQVNEQQLSWLYLPLNITQNMSIGKIP